MVGAGELTRASCLGKVLQLHEVEAWNPASQPLFSSLFHLPFLFSFSGSGSWN